MFVGSATYSGTNPDPLGTEEIVLIVRCPDFRGCNVHKQGVLFIEGVLISEGVLNERFH